MGFGGRLTVDPSLVKDMLESPSADLELNVTHPTYPWEPVTDVPYVYEDLVRT